MLNNKSKDYTRIVYSAEEIKLIPYDWIIIKTMRGLYYTNI